MANGADTAVFSKYLEEAKLPPKISVDADGKQSSDFFGVREAVDQRLNRMQIALMSTTVIVCMFVVIFLLLPIASGGSIKLINPLLGLVLVVGGGCAWFFLIYNTGVPFLNVTPNTDIGLKNLEDFYKTDINHLNLFLSAPGRDLYSESFHDRVSGRVSVSYSGVSGLVSVPCTVIQSVSMQGDSAVRIEKKVWFAFLASLYGLKRLTLTFKSPDEAKQFYDSAQESINLS